MNFLHHGSGSAGVELEHPIIRRTSVMDNTMSNNLCKALRACGIPKPIAYQVLNTVTKWCDCNGIEWTNDRIKALRQWYETSLTGEPKPPEWFKHSDSGMPLGIWKKVFDLPVPKALGVLSLNTVFVNKQLSESQKEKFLHGLSGNGNQDLDTICRMADQLAKRPVMRCSFKEMPGLSLPTVFDMNGSCPIQDGQKTVRPENKLGPALKALGESWKSVPKVTLDFLEKYEAPEASGTFWIEDYVPGDVMIKGLSYEPWPGLLPPRIEGSPVVGRVSVIQQPQLKARIVGNPNRILQVTLDPLKSLFMETLRHLPTDVTFRQDEGVAWVNDKLMQGIELAGSDLTSASDLLDVCGCLMLTEEAFQFRKVSGYEQFARYFLEVSRADWYCPDLDRKVSWRQGDVLGTGPSFGLLSLTNNVAAILAHRAAVSEGALPHSVEWRDSFRVVGDDIVMLAPMEKYYSQIIGVLGGEINHSKTLTSNKVAEFAGRVIMPNYSLNKAIKFSDPSDNSFMSYVSQLGDQAKYFLKPRQRKAYEYFKYVPGFVVDGPWAQDSFGIPLEKRYQWYLLEVLPAMQRVEPDLNLEDFDLTLLKARLSVEESGETLIGEWFTPMCDGGYQPSQVNQTFKAGGDPRLTDGLTFERVLNGLIERGDVRPYSVWIASQSDLNCHTQRDTEDLDLTDKRKSYLGMGR